MRRMARRTMSVVKQWCSRIFSVEKLDGTNSYFAIQETSKGDVLPEAFRTAPRDRCYSVLVSCSDRLSQVKTYAHLEEKLLKALPPGCDVRPMSSFLPGARGSLIRGYFLKESSEDASFSDRALRDLLLGDPVLVCSYVRCQDGGTWTQNLWPDTHSEMTKTFYVVHSEAPKVHPSTLNIINSDVFYSFEEAREVLKEVKNVSSVLFVPISPFTCIYAKLHHRVVEVGTTAPAKWPNVTFNYSIFFKCQVARSGVCVCV